MPNELWLLHARAERCYHNEEMKIDSPLEELHERAHDNEIEILGSKTCSCFFCRQTYDARKVNDWVNGQNGMTAICPECGMDAVIGDKGGEPLSKETLKALNLAYYGEDYMEKHPDAAKKFIERYQNKKITHKKSNELLYIQYLSLLAGRGDSTSALSLADLYENGDEFTNPDAKEAFSYYASASLRHNGLAMTRLGVLSQSGALGKPDYRGAYESFAKGMALGSLDALLHFSDCYRDGIGVNPDASFAYGVIADIFSESLARFVLTSGKDANIFPDLCYRLGIDSEKGLGVEVDEPSALRFFLLAEFGFRCLAEQSPLNSEDMLVSSDASNQIDAIASKHGLHRDDPVFDNDTFADSLFDNAIEDPTSLIQKYDFSPYSFDKAQGIFDFDVTFRIAPLIVDVGNLFCGFVPGTIRWSFNDVSDVKFGKGKSFSRVDGNSEDGYSFINGIGDNDDAVVTIVFTRPKMKIEKSKIAFSRKKKETDA